MKRLRPPDPGASSKGSDARRRTAYRFGLSAVVASFVVIGLLLLGAMFQEEYEEGFVRLVSFAVRLATPEEIAEAEAAGPPPPPLRRTRPDTPVVESGELLLDQSELRSGENLLPAPELLVPVGDYVVETPDGLEFVMPESTERELEAGGNRAEESE
ncbi:hypothetical protein [Candidatus Foliamicus sp.]